MVILECASKPVTNLKVLMNFNVLTNFKVSLEVGIYY